VLDTPPTLEGWSPDHPWSDEQWASEARVVRRALGVLGEVMPECLPDEPGACGAPAWQHYASYVSHLKALAQIMLEANLCTPAPGADEHFGRVAYEKVLQGLRMELLTGMRQELPDRDSPNV
jgi:hypothetical protein